MLSRIMFVVNLAMIKIAKYFKKVANFEYLSTKNSFLSISLCKLHSTNYHEIYANVGFIPI